MRIAVVGAGIGGLVTAAGLRLDGHEVLLFEQRSDPGAVGAGLTLFGNALSALDSIGLGEAVQTVSSDAAGRLRSGQRQPSGRWLVSLPPSAAPSVRSLHRADLHTALVNVLGGDRVHLTHPAAVDSEGAPIVSVDGRRETFDLVVSADGLRSDARRTWRLDRGLRYAGYTAWRGVTASRGHLADEAGETWGRGARFGIVPLPDERVYWFATLSAPPNTQFDDDRETLRSQFGPWHKPIGDLIEATPDDDLLRHDIYDLAQLPPSFTIGRSVLLGDAAHAMTPDLGQGAGQAVEDAATLILLLRDLREDATGPELESVLRRYSRLRHRRTRALWNQSRLAGKFGQAHGSLSANLRDAAMLAAPAPLLTRAMTHLQHWPAP